VGYSGAALSQTGEGSFGTCAGQNAAIGSSQRKQGRQERGRDQSVQTGSDMVISSHLFERSR
jgi:hypothetical protein